MLFKSGVVVVAALLAYKYTTSSSQILKLAPIVSTNYGDISGIVDISRDGREFFSYRGIPYAKPPVGKLRFETPQKLEKWEGVRDGSAFGESCIQLQVIFGKTIGAEDCLFLNVYKPNLTDSDGSQKAQLLPVMVFIHGGAFLEGSSTSYSPKFFMDEDVVLVTMNYRLAALGFLNSGDGAIRGNMGLKDQSMALKWVKENIKAFNGDPNKITLFGESAGGASSQFHMISPMSKGLVNKVISQSGSVVSPWVITKNPKEQAARYANYFNCPTTNGKLMKECLQKIPASEIIQIIKETRSTLKDRISLYMPTVELIDDENAFITKDPIELLKEGRGKGIPWLTGVNAHEGLLILAPISRNATFNEFLKSPSNWNLGIRKLLLEAYTNDQDLTSIKNFYFNGATHVDSVEHFENYTNLFSDIFFFDGFSKSVKLHSAHSPTYAYLFEIPTEFSLYELLLSLKGEYHPLLELGVHFATKFVNKNIIGRKSEFGIAHADELSLQFELDKVTDVKKSDPDYENSKKFVKLWVSFANDEKNMKFKGKEWKAVDKKNIEYFTISESPKYQKEPFKNRLDFLKTLSTQI